MTLVGEISVSGAMTEKTEKIGPKLSGLSLGSPAANFSQVSRMIHFVRERSLVLPASCAVLGPLLN